jgi:hypothetical protein
MNMVCSDFHYNFAWNISHSKKNSERHYRKYTRVFMQGARYSCLTLMKLEFSRQIKFHENPSSGGHVVPCGQTEMSKIIATLRNFANEPKNWNPESTTMRCLYCYATHVAANNTKYAWVFNYRDPLSLLLHRAFWRFTEYCTPTNVLIAYHILVSNYTH